MIGKNKQEIRRERRRKAEGIPPAYYREASRRIGEKVLALPAWKQAGTVMLCRLVQPLKADALIVCVPAESRTVVREVQPSQYLSGTTFPALIYSGILMLVRLVQPENMDSPMLCESPIAPGSVTWARLAQFMNMPLPDEKA